MKRITLINIKCLFTCLAATLVMSGCDFSETCNYRGKVEVLTDWDALWKYVSPSDSLIAVFYKDGEAVVKEAVKRGVGCTVPAGDLQLLTYSCTGKIEIEETGEGYPVFRLRASGADEPLGADECPMVCVATQEVKVGVDETVYQLMEPLPVVKQLKFTIGVLDGNTMDGVESVGAGLSGVCTGYSVKEQKAIRTDAMIPFLLQPINLQTDRLTQSFYVFGLNPEVAKKLAVVVTYGNGETKTYEVDLSAELNQFDQDIFTCELEVDHSGISLVNWSQAGWK